MGGKEFRIPLSLLPVDSNTIQSKSRQRAAAVWERADVSGAFRFHGPLLYGRRLILNAWLFTGYFGFLGVVLDSWVFTPLAGWGRCRDFLPRPDG